MHSANFLRQLIEAHKSNEAKTQYQLFDLQMIRGKEKNNSPVLSLPRKRSSVVSMHAMNSESFSSCDRKARRSRATDHRVKVKEQVEQVDLYGKSESDAREPYTNYRKEMVTE